MNGLKLVETYTLLFMTIEFVVENNRAYSTKSSFSNGI